MSETEGLAKLTEYLKQTRRQAEIAIDNLNNQLSDAQKENELLRSSVATLQKDRDDCIKTIQQLKTENSSKWKFKERDEWKALVDNIQKDRDRIQLEYNNVISHLEEVTIDLARTKQDLALLTEDYHRLSEQQRLRSHSPATTPDSPASESKLSMMSPVFDRHGRNLFEENPGSPRTIALTLKQELRKTNEQASEELALAERELSAKDMEIRRLENELREQQLRYQQDLYDGSLRSVSTDEHHVWAGRTTVIAETLEIRKEESILDVLFSLFSYRSSNTSEIGDNSKRVLNV